jgi:hypothetical protein
MQHHNLFLLPLPQELLLIRHIPLCRRKNSYQPGDRHRPYFQVDATNLVAMAPAIGHLLAHPAIIPNISPPHPKWLSMVFSIFDCVPKTKSPLGRSVPTRNASFVPKHFATRTLSRHSPVVTCIIPIASSIGCHASVPVPLVGTKCPRTTRILNVVGHDSKQKR